MASPKHPGAGQTGPAPKARVVALALASRAAVLACMLVSDWAFRDLDSSARLQAFPCSPAPLAAAVEAAVEGAADASPALPPAPPSEYPRRLPLAVWDTVYFARVAKCGYETDKLNAFFPLLPAAMRAAGHAASGLATSLPLEAAFILAGLAANAAAFCVAAICLHRLSWRALGGVAAGRRLADLSLLLFCCNPASVFYSAAYSEALFAACTWAGLLLLPTHHWAGVAALTAAAAARSNGILGVWFPLHKLLVAARRRGRPLWREVLRMALSCCAILAPYVLMQAQAYAAHCQPGAPVGSASGGGRPPWCEARLPSVYGFIQSEYWDVGLLRFYRDPGRLPMVLMSVPVAWLSVGGCWAYFSADWKRALTLGLYSKRDKLPRWLAAPAALLQRRSPPRSSNGSGGKVARQGQTALQRSAEAAPLVYHWSLMTAVALLAMHVNVATRFLSACPPLYWHAAAVAEGGGTRARLLWLWCFAYIALGCLLWPNFYPWT